MHVYTYACGVAKRCFNAASAGTWAKVRQGTLTLRMRTYWHTRSTRAATGTRMGSVETGYAFTSYTWHTRTAWHTREPFHQHGTHSHGTHALTHGHTKIAHT